jgi:hypothetical protein
MGWIHTALNNGPCESVERSLWLPYNEDIFLIILATISFSMRNLLNVVLYGSACLTDINIPLFQQHSRSYKPINSTGIRQHEVKQSTVNLNTINKWAYGAYFFLDNAYPFVF